MSSNLNSRQWALYNLLKNNPDKYIKQSDICKRLTEHFPIYYGDNFHDSKARLLLTNDIRALNNSDIIQKIIISNKHGVKIANKAEFEQYISGQFAAVFRKLERTRKKALKAGLDGQMRITVGQERDTTEAFADDINRLKAARLNKGLKLADVVREMRKTEKGFDVSLLSKMEHGYCKPTETQLHKLADIYGVQPFDLLGDKVTLFDLIS